MKKKIEKYYPQFLLVILAFSFFTRVYRVHIPEKYIFDEVYHAVTAKLIANNDPRAYEWTNPPPEPDTAVDWLHPPLAKYTQALFIKLFSANSFGWRFSSVIFGVLTVFMTAKLSLNLFKNKTLSLLSALIVSLDGLVLVMSRIAMNDIHVTTFILVSLNFYTIYLNFKRKKKKYLVLASVSAGLAMGTKWSGLFALLIIGFFETLNLISNFFDKKKQFKQKIINNLKETLFLIPTLIVIPIVIYILSYSHMFLIGKNFNHLIEMHKNIWWYQMNLDAHHPAESKPIQWFLNTKPVWLHVSRSQGLRGDIYAVGNPTLFWFGDLFIFMSIGYLIYLLKKLTRTKIKTEKNKIKIKLNRLFYLLFMYFVVWLPWQASPRIMFFYHYLPAVPLLSINMAFWLNKLLNRKKVGKILATLILAIIIITFILWYPHWTDIEVPIEIKNNLYFALDSWKQK